MFLDFAIAFFEAIWRIVKELGHSLGFFKAPHQTAFDNDKTHYTDGFRFNETARN